MKYTVIAGIALLAILAWWFPRDGSKQQTGKTPQKKSGTYQTVCATCHGEQGQGKREVSAPAIVSLPRWYIEEQVEKFRNGQRGNHPDDLTGQTMRDAVLALTKEQIADAVDTLESFPAVIPEPTLKGNIARGAVLYRENCMECHRFNGRGELAFRSSHVAGLQDWYLLAQWNKYKLGTRGYHPDDEQGAKMRKVVGYLENESDVRDVIHYISTLANKYPEK